jgi:polar amino acid transport system substrate-binding protein
MAIGIQPFALGDMSVASSTEMVNAKAAAMVPETIKSSGVLRVGTNLPYAPMEYFAGDGKSPTGVDVDLAAAIAARLGLKADFVNMNWDGLIPALNSGRFDMIAASVGDFIARERQADFVDYMKTGVSFVVSKGDETEYKTDSDLCGKRLSAARGTDSSRLIADLAKKCASEGKAGTSVSVFPDDNAGLLAVRSKRVDAHAMDSISASYEASTEQGRTVYTRVLADFGATKALYGMVVAKRNRSLTDALALVLADMMADGSYKFILDKYGVTDAAISAVTINAGGKQATANE